MKAVYKFFPFLSWSKDYKLEDFFSDLFSGITVAMILVPQVMAYAVIAGLPPVHGLYACLFSVAVAGLWGSSRQLSTGPVALISFLMFITLSKYAEPFTLEYIKLAAFLAIIVGFIQFLFGIFKLGFMISFISNAVIVAFSAAASIIIISTQIPNLLGFEIDSGEYVWKNMLNIIKNLHSFNFYTSILGISSIIIILLIKKISKKIPAALIVILVGVFFVSYFKLDENGVKVIGYISSEFPEPSIQWNNDMLFELIPIAFIIAIVGFLETISVSKSISKVTNQNININQEFIGQGLANIASGIFKGYPVSGSFSRSAVNFSSGAVSGISSVFVSIFVIITLLFFAKFLYFIPKTILAGIVITAVLSFININAMIRIFKLSIFDGIILVIVFILSFIIRLDQAILIGIILSLFIFFKITMKSNVSEVAYSKNRKTFTKKINKKDSIIFDNVLMLRVDMSILYINSDITVEKVLEKIDKRQQSVNILILSFVGVNFIDSTGVDGLITLKKELDNRNIKLYFSNVRYVVLNCIKKDCELENIKIFNNAREVFKSFEKNSKKYR